LGAFGYKEREVILKPFMYFWVLPVDAKEKRIPNKNM
jgi:hypothetical protein